jgi:hypothetical protein
MIFLRDDDDDDGDGDGGGGDDDDCMPDTTKQVHEKQNKQFCTA